MSRLEPLPYEDPALSVAALARQAALIWWHVPRIWPFGVIIMLVGLGSLRLSATSGADGVHLQPPAVLSPLIADLGQGWLTLLLLGWPAWLLLSSLIGTLAHGIVIGLGDAARSGSSVSSRGMLLDALRRWVDLVQIDLLCGLPALPAGVGTILWWNAWQRSAGRPGIGLVFGSMGIALLLLPPALAAMARPFALRMCLLEQRRGYASVLRAVQVLWQRRRTLIRAWALVATLSVVYLIPGSLLLASSVPTITAALFGGLWGPAGLISLVELMVIAIIGGFLQSYVAIFWTLIFREITR